MRKILLFSAIFIGFYAHISSAAFIVNQDNQEQITTTQDPPTCQSFTASSSGTPLNLTLRVQNGSATTSLINIVSGTSTCAIGGSARPPWPGTLIASGTITDMGGSGTYATATFPFASNMVAGQYYTFFFELPLNPYGTPRTLFGTGASTSTYPHMRDAKNATTTFYDDGVYQKNAWFQIRDGGTDLFPAPGVAFITPASSTTPREDFSAWELSLTNLSASTTYSAIITYSTAPFNFPNVDIYSFTPTASTSVISIPKQAALASGIQGSNYIWVAEALVIRQDTLGETITSSTFVISSQYGASTTVGIIGNPPSGTSTMVATCDPADGFFANSLCNVLITLFSPSPDSLNVFNGLASSTKNKPPFGYATSFITAVSGLENATSGDPGATLMSTSTRASLVAVFGPIDVGFAAALALLGLFWGINRIKHFHP